MKRQIGFLGLLTLSVGYNIGGSLFGLTAVAAGLTGPSLPLAFLISALPAILAVLPFSILASAAPATAGASRYMQLLSPSLAFVAIMTTLTCGILGGMPLMSQIFGLFLEALTPVDPVISGLAVLTVFYLVNMAGVRSTVLVQAVLVVLMVSALALYTAKGAGHFEASRFEELFPRGPDGLFAAAGLLFTLSISGISIVDLGGEVVNARHVIPRVLLFGILITVAITLSIMTVTAGVADTTDLEGRTLVHVAANFMSSAELGYFVIAGALLACATSINAGFAVVTRNLLILAREGLLPRILSRVDVERGAPVAGLTLTYVLGALALVSQSSLLFFGTLLDFAYMIAVTLIALLVIVLPRHLPEFYRHSAFHPPLVVLWAVCGTVVATNLTIFTFLATRSPKATLLFAGTLLTFGLYAISRRKTLAGLTRIAPAIESRG